MGRVHVEFRQDWQEDGQVVAQHDEFQVLMPARLPAVPQVERPAAGHVPRRGNGA